MRFWVILICLFPTCKLYFIYFYCEYCAHAERAQNMNSSVVVSQYPCIYHPGLTVLLKVILEITTYILDFLKSHINWYFHSLPGQCKDLRSVQFQLSTLDLYAIIFLVLILFIFWIHKPLLLLLYYQYSVASIIIIFLVLHFFVHL